MRSYIAPITGATPVTTTTETTQYTGTVSWSGSPVTFAPVTIYTATITLTPIAGFTLTGVAANFFTVLGATSVVNPVNSGTVTAVFPATTGYIVTFNGQSATVPPNPASKEVVSPAMTVGTFPALPTKTGSCFDGWYTDINGGGTEFLPYTVVTSSMTVYAKWAAPVPDIDGNVYTTIRIGTQTWMVENLRVTKYNDGTTILKDTSTANWGTTFIAPDSGKYCWYNNDSTTNKPSYGALYNWYTVKPSNTKKIAPAGWHVPTDAEWDTLTTYLGGESVAGWKLKETGTAHWASPNTEATNETGFSALPGGYRGLNGTFDDQSCYGIWWGATEPDAASAWDRLLYYVSGYLGRQSNSKRCGLSVRLVRG